MAEWLGAAQVRIFDGKDAGVTHERVIARGQSLILDHYLEDSHDRSSQGARQESNKVDSRAHIVPITDAMGGLSRSLMDHRSRR